MSILLNFTPFLATTASNNMHQYSGYWSEGRIANRRVLRYGSLKGRARYGPPFSLEAYKRGAVLNLCTRQIVRPRVNG